MTAASALGETARLSDARYKAGMDGYLGVLVAERAFYEAQRVQVGVRLAEQVNLVILYKVLGGGVRVRVLFLVAVARRPSCHHPSRFTTGVRRPPRLGGELPYGGKRLGKRSSNSMSALRVIPAT